MAERKLITDATPEELRRYAEIAFGLEVPGNAGRDRIMSLLSQSGFNGTEIVVHGEKPIPTATYVEGSDAYGIPTSSKMRDEAGREMVHLVIPTQDGAGGEDPVLVSVNGVALFIPRATPCWVHLPYERVLAAAKRRVYDEYRGGTGGLDIERSREVQEYPYNYVPAAHGNNSPVATAAKDGVAA